MDKPVAILGCGPSGLFAAQAAELCGYTPVIISRKRKSEIYGAQYLHRPIPCFSGESEGAVITHLLGEQSRYARRIYGDPTRRTSWERVIIGSRPIWNLRSAYDSAWDKFQDRIIDFQLDSESVKWSTEDFSIVISTVPLWSICEADHKFDSIPILVKQETEYTGLSYLCDENRGESAVVYNGTEHGYWYRTSKIFGHESTEAGSTPELLERSGSNWDSGFKVVGNNCNCHPWIHRVGRMGKWKSGVLTHHAFQETMELLSSDRMVSR